MMKRLAFLILFIMFFCGLYSQIAEVKTEGSYARIYNEQALYTGKYIYLGNNSSVKGYNSQYIVIRAGNYARIYDKNGQYTGKQIYLSNRMSVSSVTPTMILVRDGNYIRYYNFNGQYTGKYRYDRK